MKHITLGRLEVHAAGAATLPRAIVLGRCACGHRPAPRPGSGRSALDNVVALDAIATLARHVPAGSQLALSARRRPALPLATLQARGLELEVGPDELRMDSAQAGELLSAAGVDLPEADISELTEHTEGWPAGLYLAGLSIRARGAKAEGTARPERSQSEARTTQRKPMCAVEVSIASAWRADGR